MLRFAAAPQRNEPNCPTAAVCAAPAPGSKPVSPDPSDRDYVHFDATLPPDLARYLFPDKVNPNDPNATLLCDLKVPLHMADLFLPSNHPLLRRDASS
jgi:hypothetical protein